jgi:hypothetical protein
MTDPEKRRHRRIATETVDNQTVKFARLVPKPAIYIRTIGLLMMQVAQLSTGAGVRLAMCCQDARPQSANRGGLGDLYELISETTTCSVRGGESTNCAWLPSRFLTIIIDLCT